MLFGFPAPAVRVQESRCATVAVRLFGDIHLARDIRNQADDVIESRGRNGEFLPELREIVIGGALMVEHLLVIPCGDFCAGSAGRCAFFFSFTHPIQSSGHHLRSPESLGFVERGQVVVPAASS